MTTRSLRVAASDTWQCRRCAATVAKLGRSPLQLRLCHTHGAKVYMADASASCTSTAAATASVMARDCVVAIPPHTSRATTIAKGMQGGDLHLGGFTKGDMLQRPLAGCCHINVRQLTSALSQCGEG